MKSAILARDGEASLSAAAGHICAAAALKPALICGGPLKALMPAVLGRSSFICTDYSEMVPPARPWRRALVFVRRSSFRIPAAAAF